LPPSFQLIACQSANSVKSRDVQSARIRIVLVNVGCLDGNRMVLGLEF
jgi:hypothetical protein